MVPRPLDSRVGFFTTDTQIGSPTQLTLSEHMINRWNLARRGNKLLFCIAHSTPRVYHDTIKQGVLSWNSAFHAAGFPEPVLQCLAPYDVGYPKDVVKGDARYNVIAMAEPHGLLGYGPSVVDFRSGEILVAHVLLGLSAFSTSASRWSDAPNAGDPRTGGRPRWSGRGCKMPLLDPTHPWVLAELLHTVAHEIGHTLGLRHNFIASEDGHSSVMAYDDPVDTTHLDLFGTDAVVAAASTRGGGAGAAGRAIKVQVDTPTDDDNTTRFGKHYCMGPGCVQAGFISSQMSVRRVDRCICVGCSHMRNVLCVRACALPPDRRRRACSLSPAARGQIRFPSLRMLSTNARTHTPRHYDVYAIKYGYTRLHGESRLVRHPGLDLLANGQDACDPAGLSPEPRNPLFMTDENLYGDRVDPRINVFVTAVQRMGRDKMAFASHQRPLLLQRVRSGAVVPTHYTSRVVAHISTVLSVLASAADYIGGTLVDAGRSSLRPTAPGDVRALLRAINDCLTGETFRFTAEESRYLVSHSSQGKLSLIGGAIEVQWSRLCGVVHACGCTTCSRRAAATAMAAHSTRSAGLLYFLCVDACVVAHPLFSESISRRLRHAQD